LKKGTSDCNSLRAREDTSKDEILGSKEGDCVKGSRMRKPVPPPGAAEDLWWTEVRGKFMKILHHNNRYAIAVKYPGLSQHIIPV